VGTAGVQRVRAPPHVHARYLRHPRAAAVRKHRKICAVRCALRPCPPHVHARYLRHPRARCCGSISQILRGSVCTASMPAARARAAAGKDRRICPRSGVNFKMFYFQRMALFIDFRSDRGYFATLYAVGGGICVDPAATPSDDDVEHARLSCACTSARAGRCMGVGHRRGFAAERDRRALHAHGHGRYLAGGFAGRLSLWAGHVRVRRNQARGAGHCLQWDGHFKV
jgi:hypothetical protein